MTADGHAVLLFTNQRPLTALCMLVYVCGFQWFPIAVCMSENDLSSPTYSTLHFITSFYPPVFPSDLVTMQSSSQHIVSTVQCTEMLLDICPIHSCLVEVTEGKLSCLLNLKLQAQLCAVIKLQHNLMLQKFLLLDPSPFPSCLYALRLYCYITEHNVLGT